MLQEWGQCFMRGKIERGNLNFSHIIKGGSKKTYESNHYC